MSFEWAAQRKAARKVVAETFGLAAQYRAAENEEVIDTRVRVHIKEIEIEDDGFIRADTETWVLLKICDVPSPVIDGAIHLEDTCEDYLITRILPATDVVVPVVVRAV